MSELAYLRTRLVHAQAASELPAHARFDLAASDLDDDAFEQTVAMFGGPEYGSGGFGMADILQEYLSREPGYDVVRDIESLQTSLVSSGYLPPTYQPNGQYDDVTHAAFRRSQRDGLDQTRAGNHFGSAPVSKFFEYMNYTVPSETFKGILGIATGIWDDAVRTATNPKEVLEEGGLLGGAAAGAGTGAIVGSIVPGFGTAIGAIVGGLAGGVGGFFADYFDDDEVEDANGWEKIVGALSPVEEIKAGEAKNLFAALSTIMTASAVLKGASIAAKGVQEGAAFVESQGLRAAFTRAAPGSVSPGLIAEAGKAAIKRPIIGGAAIGGTANALPDLLQGHFGEAAKDFARGAAVGAVTGGVVGKLAPQAAVDAAMKGLSAAPIRRITESAAGKVATEVFTGASVANIGARLAGELPGQQSVEKGIEVDAELVADKLSPILTPIDYTLGMVIYPTRFMPWKAGEVAESISALASKPLMAPFAEAARTVIKNGRVVKTSLAEGYARAEKALNAGDPAQAGVRVFFSYANKAADDAAHNAIAGQKFSMKGALVEFQKEEAAREARSGIVRSWLDESAEGLSPTANRMVAETMDSPVAMQAHIESFEGKGSLLDDFEMHQRADEFLQVRTRELTERRAQGALEQADLRGGDLEEADLLVHTNTSALTPAVRDDPANGITGYQTKQHFTQMADDYERSSTRYRDAYDLNIDNPGNETLRIAMVDAGEDLNRVVQDLERRRMLDPNDAVSLRASGQTPVVDSKLVKDLRTIAKTRPAEIFEESERLAQEGLSRYIALGTGDNLLHYEHIPKMLEISGVAEMSRRKPFFDMVASLGTKVDRADMGRLRYTSIARSLDGVATKHGLGDGKQVADEIYDALKARYDPAAALRRGELLEVGKVRIKRTNQRTGVTQKEWFKIDPRDLSVEDIHDALNLGSRVTEDSYKVAADIKRQLHVGAAFGADIMHPIATARQLTSALKLNGLPAINDFMRTLNFIPDKALLSNPDRYFAKFAKGSAGYVAANVRRAHMAIQFSLSPSFDASRYIEAMSFGKMNDIPIKYALAPRKSIREGTHLSPYSGEAITGDQAWQETIQFGDEVFHGRPVMQNFDEIQIRAMHKGMLGFSPREVEYAHAMALAQKRVAKGALTRKDMDEIRETVLQIHQYGGKQTAFGNSMHFVFFPYLFVEKQVRQIQNFVFGAPGRNLLVHEGFRRWTSLVDDDGQMSTLGEKFVEDFKDHVPLARELGRLNNLSYGLSPGRFFLEGMMDKDTAGKVTQGIASFLLPGGVHSPVASAAGSAADALRHLFTPVVLVDNGSRVNPPDEFGKILNDLVPIYRDMDRWFFQDTGGSFGPIKGVVGETVATLTEGQNPMSQFTDLMDFKRTEGLALDEIAKRAGYSSWESLSQSDAGADIAAQVDQINSAIEAQYPSGAEMANQFTNSDRVKDQTIAAIAGKPERTEAEEAILAMGTIEFEAKTLAAQTGKSQEEILMLVAPIIRKLGTAYVGDRQFDSLYEELYARQFGPLRTVAA